MKKLTFSLFIILLLSFTGVSTLTSCKKQSWKTDNLMDSMEYKKSCPKWAISANICEVDIQKFTSEGTFKAFQKELPRLKTMNIDIISLKSINQIVVSDSTGNNYFVKSYSAINTKLGNETDFKNLICEAHKCGMHIIIDWDATRTSTKNVWLKLHPEWFIIDSFKSSVQQHGSYLKNVSNLNYNDVELRYAMINAMVKLVELYDIDGFKCIAADRIPINFWKHARKAIDETKSGCLFLADSDEPQIHKAFDISSNLPLMDLLTEISQEKKDVSDLIKHFENESNKFRIEDIRMQYISDNLLDLVYRKEDKSVNDSMINAFIVFTNLIPGITLNNLEQKQQERKRMEAVKKNKDCGMYKVNELITKLNELKHGNKALWSTSYKSSFFGIRNTCPNKILSFVRQKKKTQVLCIINLSPNEQVFKLNDELSPLFDKYIGETISVKLDTINKLKPWGYSVLVYIRK